MRRFGGLSWNRDPRDFLALVSREGGQAIGSNRRVGGASNKGAVTGEKPPGLLGGA